MPPSKAKSAGFFLSDCLTQPLKTRAARLMLEASSRSCFGGNASSRATSLRDKPVRVEIRDEDCFLPGTIPKPFNTLGLSLAPVLEHCFGKTQHQQHRETHDYKYDYPLYGKRNVLFCRIYSRHQRPLSLYLFDKFTDYWRTQWAI